MRSTLSSDWTKSARRSAGRPATEARPPDGVSDEGDTSADRASQRALVVRTLYDLGPISRAEVARLSGLTRTTVCDVISGLLADGSSARSVADRRPAARRRSSSSSTTMPATSSGSTLARSVPGSLVNLAARSGGPSSGRGRARRRRSPGRRLRVDRRLLEGSARRCSGSASGRRASSTAGPARSAGRSTSTGATCRSARSRRAPRGARQGRQRLPPPPSPSTRSRGAAEPTWSRSRSGAASAPAWCCGGELFHGDGYGAGEIGHVVVDDDGADLCRCGRIGCLETVAADARDRAPGSGRDRAAGEPTLAAVRAARSDAGDEARGRSRSSSTPARSSAGRSPGSSALLDVEHIVLHGRVAQLGEPWLRRSATRPAGAPSPCSRTTSRSSWPSRSAIS